MRVLTVLLAVSAAAVSFLASAHEGDILLICALNAIAGAALALFGWWPIRRADRFEELYFRRWQLIPRAAMFDFLVFAAIFARWGW